MKLIIWGGVILIALGLFSTNGAMRKVKVEKSGKIVTMRIENLPRLCIGTRSSHYATLSYQDKMYIKKIPPQFCSQHSVGEFVDVRFLNESYPLLFSRESGILELLSAILLSVMGLVIIVLQFLKNKIK